MAGVKDLRVDYDGLNYEQYNTVIGRVLEYFVSLPYSPDQTRALLQPGKGKVAVVRKVAIPGSNDYITSPAPSPSDNVGILYLRDSTNTTIHTLPFLLFNRTPALGAGAEQALPDRGLMWEPSVPFVIPEGWSLSYVNGSAGLASIMVLGAEMDKQEAIAHGYNCSPQALQANRPWIANGSIFSTANLTTLAAGRAGYAIQITDIVVRIQPQVLSGAAFCSVTLAYDDDGAGTGAQTIDVFYNSNLSESRQWVIRPNIYIPAGKYLTCKLNNVENAGRASIVVLGRYVPSADVPAGRWWAYTTPTKPGSGAGGWTLGNQASSVVKAAPGVGYRHIIEGFHIDASKDNTATSDIVLAALTFGSNSSPAAGLLRIAALGNSNSNTPITPIFMLGSHDQQFQFTLDQEHIKIPGNVAVRFDAMATAQSLLASPAASDADLANLTCLCWGRTVDDDSRTNIAANFQGSNTAGT